MTAQAELRAENGRSGPETSQRPGGSPIYPLNPEQSDCLLGKVFLAP